MLLTLIVAFVAVGLYVHFAFKDNVSAAWQDAVAREKAIAAKIAAAEELAAAEAAKVNAIVSKIKSGSPWNVPTDTTSKS